MSWLIRIYSGGFSKTVTLSDEVRNAINTFKRKLSHYLYETYTRIRTDHLFSIIIGTRMHMRCVATNVCKEFTSHTLRIVCIYSWICFSRISRIASRGGGSPNLSGEDRSTEIPD